MEGNDRSWRGNWRGENDANIVHVYEFLKNKKAN